MRKYFKVIVAILVSVAPALGLFSAEDVSQPRIHSKDSVIVFRFIPGNLMFYDSPKLGFKESLLKSVDLINRYKEDITAGKAVVVIHGYCTSFGSEAENRKAAKNRSNQVKSYFITNYWMKEDYYKTRNHTTLYKGQRDIVAVVGIEYLPGYEPVEEKPECIAYSLDSKSCIPVPQADGASLYMADAPVSGDTGNSSRSLFLPLRIKSNLIYDAMLAPSLEIEYVINDRWSAAVETSIAWWHNNNKPWFYQMATLIPEVRYSIDARRKGHYHTIGLFGGAGWYDLEYKKTGYQGELWMAGLSYSYSFPINRLLGFEAGAGLGYMSAKYDEYLPVDGHYAYQQTSRTNFIGPLRVKFALVFDLYRFFKKGGMK